MGQTAENVARYASVTRSEQDAFVRSRDRAEGDRRRLLGRDITRSHAARRHPGRGRRRAAGRRHPESVAGLQPVFRPDGTVTAANCCPLQRRRRRTRDHVRAEGGGDQA
ncbi:hypothetical protein HBB16_10665 [Pseudonocardia sp. MCCB 268]|nr:hypothetical protein [Pseudonocardia cytotoxica]